MLKINPLECRLIHFVGISFINALGESIHKVFQKFLQEFLSEVSTGVSFRSFFLSFFNLITFPYFVRSVNDNLYQLSWGKRKWFPLTGEKNSNYFVTVYAGSLTLTLVYNEFFMIKTITYDNYHYLWQRIHFRKQPVNRFWKEHLQNLHLGWATLLVSMKIISLAQQLCQNSLKL